MLNVLAAAAEKVEGAQGGLSSDAEQQLRNTMKKLEEELQQVQKERDTLQEKLKASKSPRPRSQLGADVTSEGKALALQEELDAAKAELKKVVPSFFTHINHTYGDTHYSFSLSDYSFFCSSFVDANVGIRTPSLHCSDYSVVKEEGESQRKRSSGSTTNCAWFSREVQ